jgi:hypothetical protein
MGFVSNGGIPWQTTAPYGVGDFHQSFLTHELDPGVPHGFVGLAGKTRRRIGED